MTFRVRCGLCYWQTEETTVNVDSSQASDAQRAIRPEDVTVDVLFDALEQNIGEHPDRFEVTFDPEFGYPVSIDIDIDRSTEDDDWTFELLDLTPTSEALPPLPAGSLETGVPYGYLFQIHCGMRYLEDIDGRDWQTDQPPYDGFGPFPDQLRQAFENPNESISPVVVGTIELVSDNILEFRARNSDLVVPYEPTKTNIPGCA